MTAQSKTTLKTYFNTGDIPTEGNFADLVDSFDDAGTGSAAASSAVSVHNTGTTTHANIRDAIGFNVLDYGAIGDGATDDTTAIQNAINAAAAGGGIVLFPAGTYLCNLTIKSTVKLFGAGIDITVLKAPNGSDADVIVGDNFATLTGGTATDCPRNFAIEQMTIDGNKANNSAGYGIRLYARRYYIRNVTIQNCSDDGLWSEYSGANSFADSTSDHTAYLDTMKIQHCEGDGLYWNGPNDSYITNLDVVMCGGWGIDIYKSLYLMHSDVFLNTSGGVRTACGFYAVNVLFTNDAYGLLILAGAGPCTISNSSFAAITGVALEIRSIGHFIQGHIENAGQCAVRIDGGGASLNLTMANNSGNWFDLVSVTGTMAVIVLSTGGVGTLFSGTPAVFPQAGLWYIVPGPSSYTPVYYIQWPLRSFTVEGLSLTFPATGGTIAKSGEWLTGVQNFGSSITVNGQVQSYQNNSAANVQLRSTSTTNTVYPLVDLLRGRGTVFAESDINAGDWLGGISFNGYRNGSFRTAAAMLVLGETLGTSNVAGRLDFTAYDTSGSPATNLKMSYTGLGFYGSSPVAQATASGSAAAFTLNSGSTVNDASTFDGYTVGQVVKALRNLGILA